MGRVGLITVDLSAIILTDPLRIKYLVDYSNVDIICYSAIGKRPAIRAINRLGLAGHIEEITTDPCDDQIGHDVINRPIKLIQFRQVAKSLRADVYSR